MVWAFDPKKVGSKTKERDKWEASGRKCGILGPESRIIGTQSDS